MVPARPWPQCIPQSHSPHCSQQEQCLQVGWACGRSWWPCLACHSWFGFLWAGQGQNIVSLMGQVEPVRVRPDPRQEYLGQHCFLCVPAMSFPARLLLSHPANTLVSEKQGTSMADLWLCEALSPTIPYPSAQLAHASMVLVAGL